MWYVESETQWLAAYALGTAFARVRDEDAVNDILMVTSDRTLLGGAREVVRHHPSCDATTRSRAIALLDTAIATEVAGALSVTGAPRSA